MTALLLGLLLTQVPPAQQSATLLSPFGTSTALPDEDQLDIGWLRRILVGGGYGLRPWSQPYPGGRPQVLTDGSVARWLTRDGELTLHVESDARRKLDGGVAHVSQGRDGRCCYAAQYSAGRRQGWQVWLRDGFALCTRFDAGEPIVSYEIRSGRRVGAWHHQTEAGPSNAGVRAKFAEAEAAQKEFRAAVVEKTKLVRSWIEAERDARRKVTGPARRQSIIQRDEKRRSEQFKGHLQEMERHRVR